MRKETILSGLAGALVVVTVYEGSALVRSADASVTRVEAGQTQEVGGGGAAVEVHPARGASSGAERAETAEQRIARLEQELATTRKKLAEAEFVGAITRGQLAAHQGEPMPWPGDVPATFAADRFETELRSLLRDVPGVEIESVDCSEYPCLAAIRSHVEGDAWADGVEAPLKGMVEQAFGEDGSMSVARTRLQSDDAAEGTDAQFIVFGAWDGAGQEEAASDALRQRTDFRMGQLVDEVSQPHRDAARER